jgi:hypothetical protein
MIIISIIGRNWHLYSYTIELSTNRQGSSDQWTKFETHGHYHDDCPMSENTRQGSLSPHQDAEWEYKRGVKSRYGECDIQTLQISHINTFYLFPLT